MTAKKNITRSKKIYKAKKFAFSMLRKTKRHNHRVSTRKALFIPSYQIIL